MNSVMRAWQLPAFGLSNLALACRPIPPLARGEVHIERGHAAFTQFVAGSSGTMPRRVATAQSPS